MRWFGSIKVSMLASISSPGQLKPKTIKEFLLRQARSIKEKEQILVGSESE
jgi:hypothetical protein